VGSNSRCRPATNSSASAVSTSSMWPLTGAWISSPFTSTLAIAGASLYRHLNQLYRVQHAQRPTHLLAHCGDLDRAAGVAGGDRHDVVAVLERRDGRAREVARVVARVHLERAAAARQSWSVHVEALGGEHLRGGRVHVVEEHALDAALEQADAATPLAPCL